MEEEEKRREGEASRFTLGMKAAWKLGVFKTKGNGTGGREERKTSTAITFGRCVKTKFPQGGGVLCSVSITFVSLYSGVCLFSRRMEDVVGILQKKA